MKHARYVIHQNFQLYFFSVIGYQNANFIFSVKMSLLKV